MANDTTVQFLLNVQNKGSNKKIRRITFVLPLTDCFFLLLRFFFSRASIACKAPFFLPISNTNIIINYHSPWKFPLILIKKLFQIRSYLNKVNVPFGSFPFCNNRDFLVRTSFISISIFSDSWKEHSVIEGRTINVKPWSNALIYT